jgi:SAM-dependent methyltransferase
MLMELDVPASLRRGRPRTEEEWTAGAVGALGLLAETFGRADLSDTSLLDVGCGTRFTKVILEQSIPIRRYVGVDADKEVIAYLEAGVTDPRFSFHHFDAQNDRTNRDGQPLDSFNRLPVGDEGFDIVSLFSVFTHLSPASYGTMLRLLRPHVAPEGGLLFSLFIDEGPNSEYNEAIAHEVERRLAHGDQALSQAIKDRMAAGTQVEDEVPDFCDRIPDRPLEQAVYSERYARELIAGTGWEPIELHAPRRGVVQHYFVCRPV